ncbi:MAG: DUF418 domain-containing protein [Alphaproteobacteria bacterium]|nr:DUF418 domain-containing protein [Alphaproteobacteria bacterium]
MNTPSIGAPDIRIPQLDVMRGVAVLGIYLINVFVFALPSTALALPQLWGDDVFWNTVTWSFSEIFVEGTMRGLFSILFGASALVFLSEAKMAEQGLAVVERYYRRTLLLLFFGVIHGFLLLNTLDVLYAYGLLGMFLFPLRRIGGFKLLAGGVALLALASVHVASLGEGSEPDAEPVHEAMSGEAMANFEIAATEHMRDEIAIYHTDYPTIFFFQFSDVVNQESALMYSSHLFDIGGMMLVGMALLKLGVLNGSRPALAYLTLAVLGYCMGGALRGHGIQQIWAENFDPNMIQIMTTRPLYGMDRLAITLGHVGLIGLICKASWTGFLTRPLAALGRMALTNYIGQTVISIFLFYGFGFALFGTMERLELYGVAFAVWATQAAFSMAWLKRHRLGPLEWVWRSLIYGAPQPMKRVQ